MKVLKPKWSKSKLLMNRGDRQGALLNIVSSHNIHKRNLKQKFALIESKRSFILQHLKYLAISSSQYSVHKPPLSWDVLNFQLTQANINYSLFTSSLRESN